MAREDTPGSGASWPMWSPAIRSARRAADLRASLREKLPEYMVPSAYRVVEALPLLPNGKVDRQALAALEPIPSERETAYVAPRTPVEEGLAQIWAELLHVERVGVHDDFFDLGGHSLAAGRVIARIAEAFHVDLPLRTVFEAPTVAALAAAIVDHLVHGQGAPPRTGSSGSSKRSRRPRRTDCSQTRAPNDGRRLMSELTDRIASLSPDVRARLETYLLNDATVGTQERAIPRKSQCGPAPLTFAQQRLWFLDQFEPNSPLYNIHAAFRIQGPLDRDRAAAGPRRHRRPARGTAHDLRRPRTASRCR